MENKEQFDNSIKVLVKAYLNETLKHANCRACAVGNLVCDGMGYNMLNIDEMVWELPSRKRRTYALWPNARFRSCSNVDGIKEVKSTGYTWKEFFNIESAFESVSNDPDGYKGLCAVFDVLINIHKGSDKELEEVKLQLSNQ